MNETGGYHTKQNKANIKRYCMHSLICGNKTKRLSEGNRGINKD